MTDQERDPEAATGAEGTTDTPGEEATEVVATPIVADEAAATDEADEADEGIDLAEEDDDDDAAAPPVAAATAAAARRPSRGIPARKPSAAPSVSEQAVRVDDRASAIFVLGIVGVFVAIFALALLFGYGSFFGNVFRGPTPVPTIEVTAAPSASASASAAPSGSASAAPTGSASAAPSASPVASPSPEPSPSPSAS